MSSEGQKDQGLLHTRLAREACLRLVHVVAPVSRLAFELGFEDPAHFCRFFKRHTDMPPHDHREMALRRLSDSNAQRYHADQ